MLAEVMPPNNPKPKWVIVSNPVDAMATLFKKVSGASFVISTGDHPDTLRLRTKISYDLGVPISKVEGFVAGEHGSLAYPLWSTVKILGKPLDDYLFKSGKSLDWEAAVNYVRGVSKQIVDIIGGTEVGPAAGFRDIIRSILQDRKEIISCADSLKLPGLEETVNVSVPTHVGEKMGPNLWDELTDREHANILEAAKAINENYRIGLESVGKS
jgi:malate dehydrogenase